MRAFILILGAAVLSMLPACDDDGPDCVRMAMAPECQPVIDGFDHPESVFFDQGTRAFYVSSVGVQQTTGDGFVSRIDGASGVVTARFTAGLDDPTGMRSFNGRLFVNDRTSIRIIELASGRLIETIAVPGATFLNDLTVDPANGDVYSSDTFTDTIFRVPGGGGAPEVFLRTPTLEAPNGLLVEGGTLVVNGIGPNLNPMTFQTSAPGKIQKIAIATVALTSFSERIGVLDGMERDGANLLVTDFTGKLFSVDAAGAGKLLLDGTAGVFANAAADLGFDPARRIAAVPQLNGTTVTFVDLDKL